MSSSRMSSSITRLPDEPSKPGKSRYLMWKETFEIDSRYIPIKPVGRGAYGVVCSAKQTSSSQGDQGNGGSSKVAIKKVSCAFQNSTDSRRILREIKILRQFHHDNIIALRDIMRPPDHMQHDFDDVYLVYELMDTDLHQIIRSPQALTDDHVQYFLYQILKGLKYVHSANVLHRDLKPSNLLLNSTCDLKICDFGLARSVDENQWLTEYVVTRWYRAPELLLSVSNYSTAVDVWSVGCIVAELLGRKPLFPGHDWLDQLRLVSNVLGTPNESDMDFITSSKARSFLTQPPIKQPCDFATLYPNANPLAIDLLAKMLKFNPNQRITVDEALAHPYLQPLHNPEREPVATVQLDFSFEAEDLGTGSLREIVWQEIDHFHS